LKRCWSLQPKDRPAVGVVLEHLERHSSGRPPITAKHSEHHSQNYPPIAEEDLVKLGVEPRLIPFIVSTSLWAEQSTNGPPPLSPAEAENLVETLDKVRPHPKTPALSAKVPHDQVMSSSTVNPSLKNRCFRVLRKVAPSQGILPKSYYPEGVTLSDTIPYASGWICGHLERATGWESGVCEGFSNSNGGESGQDQTGAW
jgi:hypothetical protein